MREKYYKHSRFYAPDRTSDESEEAERPSLKIVSTFLSRKHSLGWHLASRGEQKIHDMPRDATQLTKHSSRTHIGL